MRSRTTYWAVAVAAAAIAAFASCAKDSEDIVRDYGSGLVAVRTTSCYEADIPGREPLYFSQYGGMDNAALWQDKDSAMSRDMSAGFYVGDKGLIAASAMDVAARLDDAGARNTLRGIVECLRYKQERRYHQIEAEMRQLKRSQDGFMISAIYNNGNPIDYAFAILNKEAYLRSEMNKCASQYDKLGMLDVDGAVIKFHSAIEVASVDSLAAGLGGFVPCQVVRSETGNMVALLQREDKTTPQGCHIAEVMADDPLSDYSLAGRAAKLVGQDKNDSVFRMAYAMEWMAASPSNVRHVCDGGNVQSRDGSRIDYTIPIRAFASGAPVYNAAGELVAIAIAFFGDNSSDGSEEASYCESVTRLRDLMRK